MKNRIFALAGACLLTLAACDEPSPPHNQNPPVTQPDDDCRYDDGKPC